MATLYVGGVIWLSFVGLLSVFLYLWRYFGESPELILQKHHRAPN